MKQYQNWLAEYLVQRRDHNHEQAAELAEQICGFWQLRGKDKELAQWQKVHADHAKQLQQ